MSTLRLLLAPVLLAVVLVGCEGPTGPQGPQGPQGPRGPAGALVETFEVEFDVDAATEGEAGLVLFQNYDFPEITESVNNNGFVQAYYLADNDTWTAMPYTFGDESPDINAVDYTLTLGYAWNVGLVQLFYEASAPFALDFARTRTVKIVVADGRAATTAGVEWSDYSSVKQHFDLEE
ncbi:hypothetical protein CRI93_12250 [Longimonas halophila]|uniref:Collagen-like protein n=1 Tax=Longimonas halophila TaxID=1469170 RepID=A0A2H3NJD5_9BACT|nr:hypothetical protein [Longimonas halophila]PEN05675.1 hypothetical protein CRI93_12250 [Longimonas halophila]